MSGRSGIKGSLIAVVLVAGALLAFAAVRAYISDDYLLATTETGRAPEKAKTSFGPAVEFMGHSDALDKQNFKGAEVGGLSALAYDPRRDLYYALVDREQGVPARFYTLRLPVDGTGLGKPGVFDVTLLRDPDGDPFTAGRFDGEGIAFAPWGDLVVSSESEPSVRIFSLDGRFLQELPVPRKFLVPPRGEAQPNGTFEGLSISPNGDVLFVALQKPLVSDIGGAGKEQRIRVLRYESRGAEGFQPSGEFFYRTRSEGGVAEIAAVSETGLLVLESISNEIFYVDLEGAEDVSDRETLADPELAPLKKEPVVALEDCAPEKAEGSDLSSDTYEGMVLGPLLPSGHRALVLVSDDNFDDAQTTRVVSLGVRLQHPMEEIETCR